MEVSVSNATADPLPVWIEPWCDELALPPRACLTYEPTPPTGIAAVLPELEIDGGRLVIWARCPGTALVTIDGVEQDTGSRSIELTSEMLEIPVKSFVSVAFGNQPQARPGGQSAPIKRSIWTRLFGR